VLLLRSFIGKENVKSQMYIPLAKGSKLIMSHFY
jgi:hypothetical protein